MERPNGMPNGANSMQRPQPGNAVQQIHAMIMSNMRSKIGSLPQGWQSTFDLGQRAGRVMQLVTALRMLHQETNKCLQIAEHFEERCIQDSPTKEIYLEKMAAKLNDVHSKRTQAAQQMNPGQMGAMPMNNPGMGMMQNGVPAAFNMANMANMGMGGMGGMGAMGGMNMNMNMNPNANMAFNPNMAMNMNMNMNNLPAGAANMMNAGLGNAGGQPNSTFPAHLQRPMQPSSLPPQQQQQQALANNTLDPSALQNAAPQPQLANMGMANPQQQQPNGNPALQSQNRQPSQEEVTELAKRMFSMASEEKKNHMRAQFLAQFDQQRRDQIAASGQDPIAKVFMMQAREALIKRNNGQMGRSNMQQGNNGVGAAAMQQNGSQPGMQNLGMSTALELQAANAMRSAQSGEQVVPASSNPAGQVNMPQGLNPAMLANQNDPAANNMRNAFLAMQREKEKQRLQAEKQNQLAQTQAAAQQQPQPQQQQQALRGQGLNAAQNSPAMNMLTRPFPPPGQAMPPTPQQNHPQNVPPTPGNGVNQVMQHHRTMINQNSQQMSQAQAQQRREQILQALPEPVRAKLSEIPIQQANEFLARYSASHDPLNQNQIQNQNAAMFQAANINGVPMNNQPAPGSAVPGFNSQPPANQQPGQPGAMNDPAMQQRFQALQQQQQFRQKAMDFRPYPKSILAQLGVQVPEGVNEWGRLKQHVATNASILPQGTLQKVQQAQQTYFEMHPEEARVAMQEFQQRLQMAARQANMGGNQMANAQQQIRPPSLPNGQAPQAQMVQPTPQMQQAQGMKMNAGVAPNGMNPGQIRMVTPPMPTPADIMRLRTSIPGGHNMTDDQIRNIMVQRRVQQAQQQAMEARQQQNLRNQMQRAQAAVTGAQTGGNVPQQPNQQQQQPAVQRPPPAQPQQQTQPQPAAGKQQQQPQQPPQGQKRPKPSSDDVMEIPNPNAVKKTPTQQQPHAQTTQPNQMPRPQQRPPVAMPGGMPSREDLAKMTPEQRNLIMQRMQRMEALRKAQSQAQQAPQPIPGQNQQAAFVPPQAQRPGQPGNQGPPMANGNVPNTATAEDMQRLMRMRSEVVAANPKGPAVQLDEEARKKVLDTLKRWWGPLRNLDKTFVASMRMMGEEKVKDAMRCQHILMQNISDENGTVRDYLSIGPAQVTPMDNFLHQYLYSLKLMRDHQHNTKQQALAKQQQQQQAQQQAQLQQAQQVTANVAVGQPEQARPPSQQQQQQAKAQQAPSLDRKPSQQGARKASASTKAPPAPTENKSFDWGTIPSGFPPDQLKIPVTKKRKTDQDSPAIKPNMPPVVGGSPSNIDPADAKTKLQGSTAPPPPQQQQPTAPQAPNPQALQQQMAHQQMQLLQQQRILESAKARFKCDDPTCDASVAGFETAELLQQHKEAEHQPVENPLEFFLEKAAAALGVDKEGNELPRAAGQVAGAPASALAGLAPRAGVKTEAVSTPVPIGAAAANPATPASGSKTAASSSTPAAASRAGKKPTDARTSAPSDPAAAVPAKVKTLQDVMMEKIGYEMPTSTPTPSSLPQKTPSTSTAPLPESDPLISGILSDFVDDLGFTSTNNAWLSPNNDNDDIFNFPLDDLNAIDWGPGGGGLFPDTTSDLHTLRDNDPATISSTPSSSSPPNLTPDSRGSNSGSQNSDISLSERLRINFQWDAFGDGDTGVPECLDLRALGFGEEKVKSADKEVGGEDAVMLDADGEGDEDGNAEGKKQSATETKTPADSRWDWSGDLVDWDFDLQGDGANTTAGFGFE